MHHGCIIGGAPTLNSLHALTISTTPPLRSDRELAQSLIRRATINCTSSMATFLYRLKPQAQHVKHSDGSGEDDDSTSDNAARRSTRRSRSLFADSGATTDSSSS